MEKNKSKIFLNTVFWGFVLWLFGYILGFIFFALVPKNMLGWAILPFGVAFTLWVLLRKIERETLGCYFGLGLIWTLMAIALDYLFIVKLLDSTDYYKTDVYVYYALTFLLPIAVGWQKLKKGNNHS
jgi:hypothetical protein